jgi:cephalosporin hydroxylase
VEEFLKENRDFMADRGREKYLLTFNAGGYLRRVR